jgi:sugar lactone lactonase YvrE
MKRSVAVRLFSYLGLLCFASAPGALAQYSPGQSASTVIGQANFATGTAATTQSGLSGPRKAIVDPVSGKLFLVDCSNNRVLRFSSVGALASGSAAELVFGQANFTTSTAANPPTAASLNAPFDALLDSSGNLWVADSGNNRVLKYAAAVTATANNPAATVVLGQTALTSGAAGIDQQKMNHPVGLAIASNGSLFVSDNLNNRILRFDSANSLTNGAFASGILGQSNFLSNTAAPLTAASLNSNFGITVDSSNNLWVSDGNNNRVLRFDNAPAKPNGASADAVYGQANFTSSAGATAANRLNFPVSVSVDPFGRLYVADLSNNRVLVFQNALDSISNASASFVLGQQDFTTSTGGLAANKFSLPTGVFFATTSQYLYVTDFSNNRLLGFPLTAGSPAISFSPNKPTIAQGEKKNVKIRITSGNGVGDSFKVLITTPKAFSKKGKVKYVYKGSSVSGEIKNGTFETPTLPAGASLTITAQIRALSDATGKLNFTVTATSATKSGNTLTKKLTVVIEK